MRDGGGSADDSGRDGLGSIEFQRAFAPASEGRLDVRSTLAEWIRTHNLSRLSAVDLRLRRRGHWDWRSPYLRLPKLL